MGRYCSLILLVVAMLAGSGCLLPGRSPTTPKKDKVAEPVVNKSEDIAPIGWPAHQPAEHVKYDRIYGGIE